MATYRLAYNPSPGTLAGIYQPWGTNSNVTIALSNWTSTAGGFAWWMSPDDATHYIIGKCEPTEIVPVGPATWLYNGTNTVAGAGEILALATGTPTVGFRNSTNQIVIDNQNYQLGLNGIGGNLPTTGVANNWVNGSQITIISPTRAGSVVYQINGTPTSTSGQTTIPVLYVSGAALTPALNETVAIVTSTGVSTTASNRTRGTIHFWKTPVAGATNPIIARLAIAAGMTGLTTSNTALDVYNAANGASLGTNNALYWTSWSTQPF